jgi:flagellar protein FlgJ
MNQVRGAGPAAAPPADERVTLRRLAHQLEGVFLNQLFQAMRSSVPKEGLVDGGAGEDLFTSLMDEKVADQAAQKMERGLGDALYRQLAGRLTTPPAEGSR